MGRFARIVESFFDVDVEAEFAELERHRSLTREQRADHAILCEELDKAGERAQMAGLLYINAREALELFEVDAVVVESDMRAKATSSLQAEKDAGRRSKAITDADVESAMGAMFPDQYRASRVARVRATKAVEQFKRIAEIWGARQQALDALVRTARR